MAKIEPQTPQQQTELPMIQQAISADLDPAIFSEQQFDVAPNVIAWCRGSQWLNSSVDLFPRQIEVLARFFEDVCYLCSDTAYVHNVPVDDDVGNVLDRFTLLNRGVCPVCKRNRTEMLDEWIKDPKYGQFHTWDKAVVPRPVPPHEFTGIWGQRSGKSLTSASFMWPYILHRLLAAPSLPRYFNMPNDVVLEAAFVSPTLRQINQHVWMPFRSAYDSSPWFRSVAEYLKDESKRTGIQLYNSQQTFIIFPGKRLAVHILAANSSTLRGGTRVFCLPENVLVNTNRGLVPMHDGQSLVGANACLGGKLYRINAHTPAGEKPVMRVVLRNGYTLDATPEHRIRVLNTDLTFGWKLAGEVALGDYVAVGLGADFPEKLALQYTPKLPPKRTLKAYEFISKANGAFYSSDLQKHSGIEHVYSITHDLIKRGMLAKEYVKGKGKNFGCRYAATDNFDFEILRQELAGHKFKDRDHATFPSEMTKDLGYLLSKGSFAKNAVEFTFSNTNKIVVDHFVACFERTFGISPRVSVFDAHGSRRPIYKVIVAYSVVKEFLRYLGMEPSIAPTKSVPWSILKAPREVVLAFLSAYIEGDGTISNEYISMGSCSEKLLHQIQLLLLNLSVMSRLYKQHGPVPGISREQNALYCLLLSRNDSILLARELSCPCKGKQFNFVKSKVGHKEYRIPYLHSYVDTSLHGGGVAKYTYVLSTVNSIYDEFALKKLQAEDAEMAQRASNLVDTGIVWLPVTELKQLGIKPVYDISIDSEEHAFVGNGVVVHNSLCDELGWFNVSEDGKSRGATRDGTEVFTSLNNSLRTVRTKAEKRRKNGDYDALDGYMVNISSPSSISDPIEQRAAEAPKAFRMFFTRYATWEVNKDEDEALIREEFAGNPLKLKRDFCAQPPRASHPYFENDTLLKDIVNPKHVDILKYEIKVGENKGTKLLRPVMTSHINDMQIPRIMAVDAGEKKNSFAICIARYYPEQDGVAFDDFIEVSPYPDTPIDLSWCYDEFVIPLVKAFQFKQVVYDRWESGYAVSDLRTNHNVDAQRYSSAWPDFDHFRDGLLGSRIWLPPPEIDPNELLSLQKMQDRAKYPRAHFQVQVLTVNEIGKRLEKPDVGNDDLFRTAVLAYRFITKYKDLYRHNFTSIGPAFDADHPVAMFFGRSARLHTQVAFNARRAIGARGGSGRRSMIR
jgi:intein/homing endonuclease